MTSRQLYMVIDTTTLAETKLLKVTGLKEAGLWGQIYQAKGLKVIAPPLEGRGLARMTQDQLQYMYWNLTKQAPPEGYGDIIGLLKETVSKVQEDTTDLRKLAREVDKLVGTGGIMLPVDPDKLQAAREKVKVEVKPKEVKEPNPTGRPKKGTTTGLIWDLLDNFYEMNERLPDRQDVEVIRQLEDIHKGTMQVQFSKWKASKLIV